MASVEYEVLLPEHIDSIIPVALHEFIQGEPLALGLGVTGEEMESFLREGISKWLASGLGVGARDKTTGEIVGVLLSDVSTPQNTPQYGWMKMADDKQRIYGECMSSLELCYAAFEALGLQRIIEHTLFAVHRDYRAKKIGQGLAKKGLEMATNAGERACVVLATNVRTTACFRKAGYTLRHSAAFSDFRYKGTNPLNLEAMGDNTEYSILTKLLKE